MEAMVGFVLKVFLISAIIAVLIKYVAPGLAIPATPLVAGVVIVLPALVMGIILYGQVRQQS